MTRQGIRILLITIIIMDAVIVVSLLAATGSWKQAWWIALVILAIPLFIPAVLWPLGALSGWRRLAMRYPAQPHSDQAGRELVTSMAVRWRWLGFNNCIAVRNDSDHLHLECIVPHFGSMPPLSLPWSAVDQLIRGRFATKLEIIDGPPLWVQNAIVAQELALRETLSDDESGND